MSSVPVLVVDIFAVYKPYFSYLQILCSDLVSVVGFVVLKALIDVCSGSVWVPLRVVSCE
jgi:hypothetical protein